jgi:hypothetical protein
MTTVAEIINRSQINLSQLPGAGTQVFAEDILLEKLHLAFDTLLGKVWWDDYMHWLQGDLDGVLGVITTNMGNLTHKLYSYKDIQFVKVDGHRRRNLPEVPNDMPPSIITGTTPKFVASNGGSDKIFKILPATATGTINARYRTRPDTFDLDTNLLLDDTLLIRATSYQYLVDDGTNPDATSTAQSQLDEIYKQIAGDEDRTFMANPDYAYMSGGMDVWY